MNVARFIADLDEARYGHRRVTEDTAPVADSPSHAPTSTAQWKTPDSGKSKDEGERNGDEKDAIKKSNSSIPAPVAAAPSHAPTSTAQWKTSGDSNSDEGEKISKEAMKENLIQRLANEDMTIADIVAETKLAEGDHKAGCKCGFCKNKSKFGKSSNDGDEESNDTKSMAEAAVRQPMSRSIIPKRKPGNERMGFRHPSPRPKANIAPYQPSMERLNTSRKSSPTLQEQADKLLESPE